MSLALKKEALLSELEASIGRPFVNRAGVEKLTEAIRRGKLDRSIAKYRHIQTSDLATLILAMEEIL